MKKYSDSWYKIRARKEIKKCEEFLKINGTAIDCPVAYHSFDSIWGWDMKCVCYQITNPRSLGLVDEWGRKI